MEDFDFKEQEVPARILSARIPLILRPAQPSLADFLLEYATGEPFLSYSFSSVSLSWVALEPLRKLEYAQLYDTYDRSCIVPNPGVTLACLATLNAWGVQHILPSSVLTPLHSLLQTLSAEKGLSLSESAQAKASTLLGIALYACAKDIEGRLMQADLLSCYFTLLTPIEGYGTHLPFPLAFNIVLQEGRDSRKAVIPLLSKELHAFLSLLLKSSVMHLLLQFTSGRAQEWRPITEQLGAEKDLSHYVLDFVRSGLEIVANEARKTFPLLDTLLTRQDGVGEAAMNGRLFRCNWEELLLFMVRDKREAFEQTESKKAAQPRSQGVGTAKEGAEEEEGGLTKRRAGCVPKTDTQGRPTQVKELTRTMQRLTLGASEVKLSNRH